MTINISDSFALRPVHTRKYCWETKFPNSLQTFCWKQFANILLETVSKQFGNCLETMFPVHTSVVIRMPGSEEVAAAACVFNLTISIQKCKKKG